MIKKVHTVEFIMSKRINKMYQMTSNGTLNRRFWLDVPFVRGKDNWRARRDRISKGEFE